MMWFGLGGLMTHYLLILIYFEYYSLCCRTWTRLYSLSRSNSNNAVIKFLVNYFLPYANHTGTGQYFWRDGSYNNSLLWWVSQNIKPQQGNFCRSIAALRFYLQSSHLHLCKKEWNLESGKPKPSSPNSLSIKLCVLSCTYASDEDLPFWFQL